MSEVIIFVDDCPRKSPSYLTGNICNAIRDITANKGSTVKTIEVNCANITIANALPLVKKEMRGQVDPLKDTIIGISVDLIDENDKPNRVDPDERPIHSGEVFLERMKQDPDIKKIPIVIYTSRHLDIPEEMLVAKGAIALIRRNVVHGTDTVFESLAKRILRAFDWKPRR